MAEDYQTSLRFSLKEAVWFKKGQEIENLLSIELNPQIEIEEKEDYVQVTGALELYGEYNKKESEESFSLRDHSQVATVEEVVEQEDGVCVFTHYFPIDVTIPKKRVKELVDIYVLVESFDYELPKSSSLQIMADVAVTGLYEEEQEAVDNEELFESASEGMDEESQGELSEKEESLPNLYYQSLIQNVFKEFSFEARKAPEEVGLEQEEEVVENDREPVEYKRPNQEEVEELELEEIGLQYQRESGEKEQQVPTEVQYQREVTPHIEFFSSQVEENYLEQDQNQEPTEEEEIDGEVEEAKAEMVVARSENELYLTKLFGNEGENFKKLRVYIVQNGDTLESIAEKYEVQAQQIARRNQLEESYLMEGQILYVPVKKTK